MYISFTEREKIFKKQPKYVSKPSVLKLKVKRLFILEVISNLQKEIANQEETPELNSIKNKLQIIEKKVKYIGFSKKEFFDGNLLNIKNYEKYYNFFFCGRDINNKNNQKDFFDVNFKNYLLGILGEKSYNELSEYKINYYKRFFLDKRSENLEITKKLNYELDNYFLKVKKCKQIFNEITTNNKTASL